MKTPTATNSTRTEIIWEDDGPDRIRGYIANPKTTLFIIERHPTKRYRGCMTGAVIPDDDEGLDGLLGNALISWLQGFAAPNYLREFELRTFERLLAQVEGERLSSGATIWILPDKKMTLQSPAMVKVIPEGPSPRGGWMP
jgi:hypothetical protein